MATREIPIVGKIKTLLTHTQKVTPQPSPVSVWDELPEEVRREADKLVQIIIDIIIDDYADAIAKKVIDRYLKFVWSLPASETHHHSKPFGLFLHSLETAVNNLKVFEGKLFFRYTDGTIDSFATRKARPREQYAYFLAGLLNHVGQALEFVVKSTDNDNILPYGSINHLVNYFLDLKKQDNSYMSPDTIYNINNIRDYLQDILQEYENEKPVTSSEQYAQFLAGLMHDIGKATDHIVTACDQTWQPLKEPLYSFYKRHNGNIQITPRKDRTYRLHQKTAAAFAARLISYLDYEYIGIFNFADLIEYFSGASTANKFKQTIESDMKSTGQDIASTQRANIPTAFIDEVRTILLSGRYPFNSNMPGAWIGADYTAVAVKICEEARMALVNNEKVGKAISISTIWKHLVDSRFVRSEDWRCVYIMDIETQGKAFQQKVIQIKNSVLWEGYNMPELCKLKIRFNISTKD